MLLLSCQKHRNTLIVGVLLMTKLWHHYSTIKHVYPPQCKAKQEETRAHIRHVRVLKSSLLFISQMLLMTFIHRWFRKNSGGVMLMNTVCNVTGRSCYLSCHTLSTCEKRSASFGQLQVWLCLNVCVDFKRMFLKLPKNMFHF